MTDYVKLFKTCSDHAVGTQSVNQALENNIALFERLDKRHALGTRPNDVFIGPGKHDDVLIARTVADFTVVSGAGGTQLLFSLVSGPFIFDTPTQLASGQWRIDIPTPTIFSAIATIKGASLGIARHASCFVGADQLNPYVVVSTWNVAAGALADYDFSVAIWAEGVA